MENIILIVVVGILNLLSFYFGAKLAGKDKEEFTINPVQLHEKHVEKKEEKTRQEEYLKQEREMQTNFENLDNFDGTSIGQKDFD